MSCIRLLKVTTGLLDWDFPPWGQLRLMLWRRGGCWPSPPACPEGASGPPPLLLPRFAPDSIKQGPSPRAREHGEIPFKGLFVQAMPCPSSCPATETPTLPAGLRGSSARRSRGIQLQSVSSTPHSAQTPGAPSPQSPPRHCEHREMLHCHTSGLSAQLLFSGSMEIRTHAIGIAPRCLQHQLPVSPRAVGSAERKEMFPWKAFIPSRSSGRGVPGQPPAMS